MTKYTEEQQKQIERLSIYEQGQVDMKAYLKMSNILDIPETLDEDIPLGFKRCGKCRRVMKFYLFNKNNGTKTLCTGNCKECQKVTAQASYERTKCRRNYKKYYAEHKERKQEQSRKYYVDNKETILDKQKQYHQTNKGRKVMKKSHTKRRKLMAANKGIAYKREWVIDRDKCGGVYPICYLCGKPVKEEKEIHLDHVVPIVLGGMDCFTNIACTHAVCNLKREKDARNLDPVAVESIQNRAEKYIDEHIDLFD